MALKNELLFLVLASLVAFATAARNYDLDSNTPGYNLKARLDACGGPFVECWTALLKLKSCSDVTIKYFLTGYADDISAECCSAIETSTSKCWPGGFTSLGFTTKEGNILSAYCAAFAPVPAPSPA